MEQKNINNKNDKKDNIDWVKFPFDVILFYGLYSMIFCEMERVEYISAY